MHVHRLAEQVAIVVLQVPKHAVQAAPAAEGLAWGALLPEAPHLRLARRHAQLHIDIEDTSGHTISCVDTLRTHHWLPQCHIATGPHVHYDAIRCTWSGAKKAFHAKLLPVICWQSRQWHA